MSDHAIWWILAAGLVGAELVTSAMTVMKAQGETK
jgi:uncharacterized membrane protein YdcZ (DUF606 family)